MKIRKLQLKNIGVFDDEAIEFQKCPEGKAEIHIFTGENGSGKTTILSALISAFASVGEFGIDYRNSFEKRFQKSKSYSASIFFEENNFDNSALELKATISEQSALDVPIIERNLPLNEISKLIASRNLVDKKLSFYPFAYSSYRRIRSEKIELGTEKKEAVENPLYQALNFIKEENSKFTINEWLGRNLSRRALAKEENNGESKVYDENIKGLEKAISDVIGREIRFKLKTNLNLVLIENYNDIEREIDFDVLPDGLKSLISWIGDLLMRLDSLNWENDTPIFEREIVLFLDEIEVHLHPAWQRKVLPVVQKLFKNSQIFVSTHSPFVVNSVDDAWVYKLELNDSGKARVANIEKSEDARSYRYVLRNTFDIENEFGIEIEKRLKDFYTRRDEILAGNGNSKKAKSELKKIAKELSKQSKELKSKIDFELFQLSEITGEEF